jgi:O6-methylguanine-DNA--protein-cysteine methyltransferase
VVAAGNRLGGFSAAGGVPLKRRLLEMEAAARGNGVALGV